MFNNRKLEVKMVKSNKSPQSENVLETVPFEKKVKIINLQIEKNIKRIAIAVAAYVLLDTFRQVAVEQAKQK